MSVEFDVYCLQPHSLSVGAVITLDGVDGFFDQYFDGLEPGELLRFVVLAGGPSAIPETAAQLELLPFIEARVRRCDATDGEVEILTCTNLGKWLRSLELDSMPSKQLQVLVPDAPIVELLSRASREGEAYWKRGARYWRKLDETTAVLAHASQSGTRVVLIRTNGTPALVTRVELLSD
jgi:hypothetical protein